MAVTAAELEILVTANTGDAVSGLDAAGAAVDSLANRVSNFVVGRALEDAGKSLLGFASNAIKTGADFQQEMQFVDYLSGDMIKNQGKYYDDLQNKALQVSETSTFTATQVAQGMQQLAQEGWTPLQIIGDSAANSLIDNTAAVAMAAQVDMPTAANALGNFYRVWQDTGTSVQQSADIFTAGLLRSGQSLSSFVSGLQYLDAPAHAAGVAMRDVVAALVDVDQAGIRSRSVGTSFRTLFQDLGDPAKVAQMQAAGIAVKDYAGNLLPLTTIIGNFHDALAKIPKPDQLAFLKSIFGANADSALLQLFRDGPAGLQKIIDEMNGLGHATDVVHALLGNLAGSFHILGSSLFTLEKVMGDSVAGFVKPFVDGLITLVNAAIGLPAPILAAAMGLIAFGGALAYATGFFMIFNALGGFGAVGAAFTALGIGLGVFAVVAVGAAAALSLLAPKLETFLKYYRELTSSHDLGFQKIPGLDPLRAGLEALGLTFPSLAGVTDFLRQKLDQFGQTLQTATMLGMNPFDAVLRSLALTLPGLAGPLNDLKAAGDALIAGYGQGGVLGVFAALRPALVDVGKAALDLGGILVDQLVAGIQTTNWGAIAATVAGGLRDALTAAFHTAVSVAVDVGQVAVHVGGWLVSAAENLWDAVKRWALGSSAVIGSENASASVVSGGALVAIESVAVNVFHWAISAGENLFDKLKAWALGQLGGGGGGSMNAMTGLPGPGGGGGIDLGQVAVNVGNWVLSGVESLAHTFDTGLAGAINAVNWNKLGQDVGSDLGKAMASGPTIAVDLAKGMAGLVAEAVKLYPKDAEGAFLSAAAAFATGLTTGFAKQIPNMATSLGNNAADILKLLSDGFAKYHTTLENGLKDAVDGAVNKLGFLADKLKPKGQELLTGLKTGFDVAKPVVEAALKTEINALPGQLGSLADTLMGKGLELLAGLAKGIGQAMPSVVSSVKSELANLPGQIGSLTETLVGKGLELLAGLAKGIGMAVPVVLSTLKSFLDGLAGNLGTLTGLLVGKGLELLTGLVKGIWDNRSLIGNILKVAVTDAVMGWVGLNVLLVKSGADLIVGLVKGIWDHRGDILTILNQAIHTAVTGLVGLPSLLVGAGIQFIFGFVQGIAQGDPQLVTAAHAIKDVAVNAFADAKSWLESAGTAVITGLLTGIATGSALLGAAFKAVKSSVTDAFADAKSWLKSAGGDVISGFTDAFNTPWTTFKTGLATIKTDIEQPFTDAQTTLAGLKFSIPGLDSLKSTISDISSAIDTATSKLQNLLNLGSGSSSTNGAPTTGGATAVTGPTLPQSQQDAINAKIDAEIAANQLQMFKDRYGGLSTAGGTGDMAGKMGMIPGVGDFMPGLAVGGFAGAGGGVLGEQQGFGPAGTGGGADPLAQAQSLASQLQAAGQKAGQAFATALGAGLQTGLTAVTAVMSAITSVVTTHTAQFAAAGTTAGQGFARALGTGMQLALTMVTAVTTALTTIVQAGLTRLASLGQSGGQQFATGLGQGMQLALTMVTAVTAAMGSIFAAWSAATVALGQTTGNGFAVAWGAGLQAALTTTSAVAAAMTGILTTFAGASGNAGRTAGSGFDTGFAGGLQAALDDAASYVGSILDELNSAADGAFSAGAAVGQGLADGMNSELGAVQSAAAALASAAMAAANAVLGNASPSKMFRQIGRWAGEGLQIGLADTRPLVASAGAGLATSAIAAVRGTFGGAAGGGIALAPAGRGTTTVNVTLQFQGDVYGQDDFEARVADAATTRLVPVIVDAIAMNDRTMGVRR